MYEDELIVPGQGHLTWLLETNQELFEFERCYKQFGECLLFLPSPLGAICKSYLTDCTSRMELEKRLLTMGEKMFNFGALQYSMWIIGLVAQTEHHLRSGRRPYRDPLMQYIRDFVKAERAFEDSHMRESLLREALMPLQGVCNRLICIRERCRCPPGTAVLPLIGNHRVVDATVVNRKRKADLD